MRGGKLKFLRRLSLLFLGLGVCLILYTWKSFSNVTQSIPVNRRVYALESTRGEQSTPFSEKAHVSESVKIEQNLSYTDQDLSPSHSVTPFPLDKPVTISTPPSNTNSSILLPNKTGPISVSPSILQDLERCSRTMGVTEESLLRNRGNIAEVSRRAELFLKEIRAMLPRNFSSRYKNPCWTAEKPKAYHDWKRMLMTYFHPGFGRKLRKGVEKRFTYFLSKPVDENSNDTSLLCLPYFFLAGFPKSATTTIHEALARHPQIIEPSEKEPHWWTRVLSLSKSRAFDAKYFSIAFITYTFFFDEISSELADAYKSPDGPDPLITYDASQSTLWDSNFYYKGQDYCAMPAVISRVLPNTKFIVVLRNPITRLYSHFVYSCKLHYGGVKYWPSAIKAKPTDLFHTEVTKDIKAFNECLQRMSVFECVSNRTSNTSRVEYINSKKVKCGVIWHRLVLGMYAVHIKKWLQFYPMENFLFIKMEEISEDTFVTMAKITQFLGIVPVSREAAHSMLGRVWNVLLNASSLHVNIPPMEEKTRTILEEFYHPYNQELAKMLNDDRFLWN